MQNIIFIPVKIIIVIFLSVSIPACQSVYLAGTSQALLVNKQERSFTNYVEDTIILAQLKNIYFSTNEKIFFNVGVEVNEGRILLTGGVEKINIRIEATKLAWGIEGVREVINEIQISSNEGILNYADDLVMKTKIKGKLLFNKEILNLNYSVEVVNGIVYLIGIAQNQEELTVVIDICKETYGVKDVIEYVRLKSEVNYN